MTKPVNSTYGYVSTVRINTNGCITPDFRRCGCIVLASITFLQVARAPVQYPSHFHRYSPQSLRYAAGYQSLDSDQHTVSSFGVTRDAYLKDVTQAADVPKGPQYRLRILYTLSSPSCQIVIL